MQLDGVRALVTGGTSGLGRAMVQALVAEGADVALTGRDRHRTAEAAQDLGAHGIACDATDEASVAHGVDEAYRLLGGVDLLVNNAGIGMRTVNPAFLAPAAALLRGVSGGLPGGRRHQPHRLLPRRPPRRPSHARRPGPDAWSTCR